MEITSSWYFILAGLCEIGGGYLVWLWLGKTRPIGVGLAGAAILVVYGIVPTCNQPTLGGSTPYGGVFIVLSILWACRWTGSCRRSLS